MFVIVVLNFLTGGPVMCDGELLVSRCYRVCVYECVVWKCDPPIVDCHRGKAFQQRQRTGTQTSWRPQNYGESA